MVVQYFGDSRTQADGDEVVDDGNSPDDEEDWRRVKVSKKAASPVGALVSELEGHERAVT